MRAGMKTTKVDENGDVRCPKCGARNAFTSKRTGKAKLLGGLAVGVGALAAPKRLQCQGCGTYLKQEGALARAARQQQAARAARPPKPAAHRKGVQWRCEKNGHLLEKHRDVCPIDGSPAGWS